MKDQHKLPFATRAKTSWPSRSREYRTWERIKRCCYESSYFAYKNYGGRGIRVCQRWLGSFEAFLSDMGKKPKGLSLGRIDNDGDYEPSNCRWETAKQQMRNRRDTVYLERGGAIKSMAEWAEELKINYSNLEGGLRYNGGAWRGFTRITHVKGKADE